MEKKTGLRFKKGKCNDALTVMEFPRHKKELFFGIEVEEAVWCCWAKHNNSEKKNEEQVVPVCCCFLLFPNK